MLQKKSQIVLLLFVFLPGIFGKLYGQYPSNTHTAFPSASSTGLVSSVNHTTGTPNIGVPLFNLNYLGIQVPLALSYNTSGIRVEDRAAEVGMGWRLSTGGKITRVVRQQPDDLTLTSQLWGLTALQLAAVCFKTVQTRIYKDYNAANSEPDLFYYEIPGKSGMFVLDGQGHPHTIPWQSDISIAVVSGEYFTIQDHSGNLYTFGNALSSRESTHVLRKNENFNTANQLEQFTYTSTWHLNSIKSYSGHVITFEYAPGITETLTSASYMTIWTHEPGSLIGYTYFWSSEAKEYPLTTITGTKVISGITAGVQRLAFVTAANQGNSIGEITYSVNNSTISKYRFVYETFANNRVFLTAIEKGAINSWQKFYSFEYNKTRLLPAYGSYDYDSWGYYNGKNNTTHLPSIPSNTHPFTDFIIPQSPGADKSPALEYTKACILTAIVYNTGGKVEYTYGLNKHNSQDVGGLRVEKICYRNENNQEVSSTLYNYSNSALAEIPLVGYFSINDPWYLSGHIYRSGRIISSGVLSSRNPIMVSSMPFNDLFFTAGSHIMYGHITETFSDNSKTEYTYSLPSETTRYEQPDKGDENRYGDVWIYIKDTDELTDGAPYKPGTAIVPKTSRFWRHGLLLATKKYDTNNAPVEETTYVYKYDQKPPVIIKGYAPFKSGYDFVFEYKWESQPVLLESVSTKHFNNPASTTTTTTTYDNVRAVPTSVTKTDAAGNRHTTTYRYAHDLTHSPANLNFPTNSLMNSGILAPVETVTYKNDRVVSAEFTEYGFVPLAANPTTVLPVRKYYLPLQSPINSITPVDYNGSGGLTYHPGYRLSQTLEYEPYGRIQTQQDPEGRITHFIYAPMDANGKIADERIAEVSNASPTSFFYEGFEYSVGSGIITSTTAKTGRNVYAGSSLSFPALLPGSYLLTYWKSTDAGRTWHKQRSLITLPGAVISNDGWIDEVRVHPANARMKTWTYLPGVGVSSETDHNGVTTYREYDPFGRLHRLVNTARHVLEAYDYHFKNQ